ncbi:uncharacterized protein VTP21DRAFT_10141 [Calcarisporiella thermophila]|uniref:uncharacterized protein n=1 Tax=Calcarisporiella thermophila TaxID=911321 RepID=UPI003744221C
MADDITLRQRKVLTAEQETRADAPPREEGADEKDPGASSNVAEIVSSSVQGASAIVVLQLLTRMMTFGLHQVVLRYTSRNIYGIASVQLELLYNTILFISRESFRGALLRGDSGAVTASEPDASQTENAEGRAKNAPSRGEIRDAIPLYSREGDFQKVTNLAYLPLAFGLLFAAGVCGYYLHQVDDQSAQKYPYYRTSIIVYGLSAVMELVIEPLFMVSFNHFHFKLRVVAEGVAVALRCLVTVSLAVWGAYLGKSTNASENAFGLLPFAIAQMIYALTLVVSYVGYYLWMSGLPHQGVLGTDYLDWKYLFPRRLFEKVENRLVYSWFDKKLLGIAITLGKQSFVKHLLNEGDKFLVARWTSHNDQGVYALVFNYGSLVVRILFMPLEETARILFSKLLSDLDSPAPVHDPDTVPDGESRSMEEKFSAKNPKEPHKISSRQQQALVSSADLMATFIRFYLLLGLVFIAFATNYTGALISLLNGRDWSRSAFRELAAYCVFVPIIGVNGITETFVQAVSTDSELTQQSYLMTGFSIAFVCAGFLFMQILSLGTLGLILANMVNLLLRIAYSWYFIRRYFLRPRGYTVDGIRYTLSLPNLLPRPFVILAFAIGWALTFWSGQAIGWATLPEIAKHIGVGGACFACVAIITWTQERVFVRKVYGILRSKGKKHE